MSQYDVIIVGAGPAGMTAAIYAVRANLKTLMLDQLAPGGQIINTNEIENYPGVGAINGAELAIKMFEQTQELGAEFDYKTVTAIEDKGAIKLVKCLEDDTVYETKAVILASGTRPRRLGIPGEEEFAGSGLSWCAICDGAQYKGKDVVVIGGGNSAVEESLYLASITNKLTVVTMFDLTADPKACDKLRALPNVTIYPYQEIIEITGTDKLTGIRFKSTKEDAKEYEVSCDGIFEYIGLEPTATFCKSLGILNEHGFIEVDHSMKTKIDGIFGAGDINTKFIRQVVTACSDGAIAANSAQKYVESLH